MESTRRKFCLRFFQPDGSEEYFLSYFSLVCDANVNGIDSERRTRKKYADKFSDFRRFVQLCATTNARLHSGCE